MRRLVLCLLVLSIVAPANAQKKELLPPRAFLELLEQKGGQVKLKASAVAGAKNQPVTVLRLLIAGRPLPDKQAYTEFKEGRDKAEIEWTVTIPSGKHKLAVLARSPDASSVSDSIQVDVAAPPSKAVLHVLAVGINKYDDSSLNLRFASPDAEMLARGCAKNCKGPLFADVLPTTLLDKQAQRQAILDQIQAVCKKARDSDLFVVYFAGHGVKEKDRFFFLTAEARTNDLAKTALSGEDLRKALGEFPCQVLLMLDSCHAAGFGEVRKQVLLDGVTRVLTDDDSGVAVMCAALNKELVKEGQKHGLFAKAVVDGLEGKAQPDPDTGLLHLHQLHAFVLAEVERASAGKQRPFLILPATVKSFPLRRVPRKPTGEK